ncbi:MAG: sulfonate ABC transporter permease [Legionellales bacterium]|nr:sulfonate ABC transporter permease [Legionellales bacterium]HAV93905.1 sulfonate ABC transporter permease [Pseudomonadota bacterium]
MSDFEFKTNVETDSVLLPNIWDLIAFVLIFGVFFFLGQAMQDLAFGSDVMDTGRIDLSLSMLPTYALFSVVRMFVALLFSLLVTFVFGTLAARSVVAERFIIPIVDVLQSIPILGYLTIAATVFEKVFHGDMLGYEMVAVFMIFTSQVWNMILSFYQSLIMLPADMRELASVMQLRRVQKFWRIDVPYAMPDLLMNMMVSLSAGWFYIMESEAIVVSGRSGRVLLPGLGSYMWQANLQENHEALLWALLAVFIVILCYDQLMFRPLLHIVRGYQSDDEDQLHRSWIVNLLSRTRWFKWGMVRLQDVFSEWLAFAARYSRVVPLAFQHERPQLVIGFSLRWLLVLTFLSLVGYAVWSVLQITTLAQLSHILLLGFFTFIRVFSLLLVCMVLWVPVGVWVGFRPRVAAWVMPVIQFLAAFPPNMLYPFLMWTILTYGLNVNIWCAPLMVLGTQWYILFNVISAVQTIDKELTYVVRHMGVTGMQRWRRFILPSIAPHLVSGAMAASGGAWNASIVAEVLTWGKETKTAVGLGAYIHETIVQGDLNLHILAVLVMCFYVVVINRVFWHPLYRYVERRFAS